MFILESYSLNRPIDFRREHVHTESAPQRARHNAERSKRLALITHRFARNQANSVTRAQR